MPLTSNVGPCYYEPLLGIVHFKMLDGSLTVHCMVSETALRNRAARADRVQQEVEALFEIYRTEVESLAAKEYGRGVRSPIVRATDLAPPPPLPPSQVGIPAFPLRFLMLGFERPLHASATYEAFSGTSGSWGGRTSRTRNHSTLVTEFRH